MAALVAAFVVPGAAHAACPTVHQHNQMTRHVLRAWVGGHGGDFHANTPTRHQLVELGGMRACVKHTNRLAYQAMRASWNRHAAENRYYRHLDAITACGEWVLCGVVEHESATSGYYRAYNDPPDGCSGHGCIGAYQIDAQWFSRSCARWARVMWTPAGQHECAYVILHLQGPGAWAL